jgi:hypothetical protein
VIGKRVSYSVAASPGEVDRIVLEALQQHLGLLIRSPGLRSVLVLRS